MTREISRSNDRTYPSGGPANESPRTRTRDAPLRGDAIDRKKGAAAYLKDAETILDRRKTIYKESKPFGVAADDLDAEDQALEKIRAAAKLTDLQANDPRLEAFYKTYYSLLGDVLRSKTTAGAKIKALLPEGENPEGAFWLTKEEKKKIQDNADQVAVSSPYTLNEARAWIAQLNQLGLIDWGNIKMAEGNILRRVEIETFLQAANLLYRNKELNVGELAAFSRVILLKGLEAPKDSNKTLFLYGHLLKMYGLMEAAVDGRSVPGNPYQNATDRVRELRQALNKYGPLIKPDWTDVDEECVRNHHKGWAPEKIYGKISRMLESQEWGAPFLETSPQGTPRYLYDWVRDAATMDAVIYLTQGHFVSNEVLDALVQSERDGDAVIPEFKTAESSATGFLSKLRLEEGVKNYLLLKYKSQQFFDADLRRLDVVSVEGTDIKVDMNDVRWVRAAYRNAYREDIGDAGVFKTEADVKNARNTLNTLWFADYLTELTRKLSAPTLNKDNKSVPLANAEQISIAKDEFMIGSERARNAYLKAVTGSGMIAGAKFEDFKKAWALFGKPGDRAFDDFMNAWASEFIRRAVAQQKIAGTDRLVQQNRNTDFGRRLLAEDRAALAMTLVGRYSKEPYKNVLLEKIKEIKAKRELLAGFLEKQDASTPLSSENAALAGQMLRGGYSASEVLLLERYVLPKVVRSQPGLSGIQHVDDISDKDIKAKVRHRAKSVLDIAVVNALEEKNKGRADNDRFKTGDLEPREIMPFIDAQLKFFDQVLAFEAIVRTWFGKLGVYPDLNDTERESEIMRIAESAQYRGISEEALIAWFETADRIKTGATTAAVGKVDMIRILYAADSMWDLGLAASPIDQKMDPDALRQQTVNLDARLDL